MKLIGSWFLERSANFYSVLSRENSKVSIAIFYIVCFETVMRGLDVISNNQFKNVVRSQELDFRLITTSINNFREIHISWLVP